MSDQEKLDELVKKFALTGDRETYEEAQALAEKIKKEKGEE